MDTATDSAGNPVSIDQVKGLTTVPDLWCGGELPDGSACGARAWTTALHSTKRAAAFAAHHGDGCDEGSERSTDAPGDVGYEYTVGTRPLRWRMRLGAPAPSSGPDGRRRPDAETPGSSTRRHVTDRTLPDIDTATQRSFSTLLVNLLSGSMPADVELVLGARDPILASHVVVHADHASSDKWMGKELIIWGKVAGLVRTQWDGLMLRMEGAADDVAVLVDKKSLVRLKIADVDSLISRHVIAYGTYTRGSATQRPYVRALNTSVAFNPRVVHRRR
ncbi:hypothetical protein [uncultured Microbacterium sp.]|uniref:hypothetical protein n=1 Tax=uncultured Microbacterium sp. TaxID=191216 RepID=UPI0025F43E88|nr:hypothetical protein [uncultured Microbacterium sp.]